MNRMTLKDFRNYIFTFARILSKSNSFAEVAYNGEIYRIWIQNTGRSAEKRVYKKRRVSLKDKIAQKKCPACGGIEINGVCMNESAHTT